MWEAQFVCFFVLVTAMLLAFSFICFLWFVVCWWSELCAREAG